jgi:aminoglycoside N3'-acetyltransferase
VSPADAPLSRPDEVAAQLRALGVAAGDVLLVHTSFRAVRPVPGGIDGLIDALLAAVAPGGTVVMPSMSYADDEVFDPRRSPCPEMGAVADHFWRRSGVLRSEHATAFAASGRRAAEVTAPHPLLPCHGPETPPARVAALGGSVLILGVGFDACTLVHVAETIAKVPYAVRHHMTVLRDGRPTRIEHTEPDHCCANFAKVGDALRATGRLREGPVGAGRALLFRARDGLDAAQALLRDDPLVFLHPPGAACGECDAARSSIA